jgi:hypothetical protein
MSLKARYTKCSRTIAGSVFVLLLLIGSSLFAQVRSGTITGKVTDPNGAVVVNAQVTVTDSDTNVSYSTKTASTGDYTVPYLATGTYSVTITQAGFKTFVVGSLHLDSAETAKIDAQLTIGTNTQTVEVTASSEHLQTENSTVAGVTSAAIIDSVPNITENPLYYTSLQNGVVPRNETSNSQTLNSFGIGVAGRAEFSAFGVNGGRAFENDIQLDGLPIMGNGFNEATIIPNLEGIQEVQVISNNFSAQYGHGQSVMSLSTKSGTNNFHGQVSYLNRNEALNANTSSNKAQGIRRPAFKVDDIGGALSGPIHKNNLFFATSYHWLSHNQGATVLSTVPTALERTGDFGSTLVVGQNSLPAPAQVFNPFSVTTINSNLYQRAEFPKSTNCSTYGCGDIIPNPNSAGLALLSLYPMPNRTPLDVYNTSNFSAYNITTVRHSTNNNRIDWKYGRHSVYGTGGLDFGTILQPPTYGSSAVKGFNDAPTTTQDRNYYAQIGDTIVMSPTFFIDVRYGATRTNTEAISGNHSGFTNYAALGITPGTQALFAVPGAAPVAQPSQGLNMKWSSLSGGQFANKQEHQISHAVNGAITKVHGRWTFKAGSEYRVTLANYTDFEEASTNLGGCCANDPGGNYTFQYVNASGATTAQDNTNQLNGVGGATTLVGEGVWFVRPGANLKPAYASKYFAAYSQNDWKLTSKITLNLGLRWDVQPGLTERYNRLAGYDFTTANAFGSQGNIDFPGTNGYSRNLWNTEWHDFQPRVGGAWQLRPNLVARGGFAITYLPSNSGYFSSPNDYGEATFASGNTGALTFGANPSGVPTERLTDTAPVVAATGSNAAAPQTFGVAEAYFDRHLKNQITKQANFFIEQSFGNQSQWLLAMGWAGAYSDHLTTRNLPFENQQLIPASTLSSWRSTYIASNGTTNPQTQQVPNPYQPATGALLPFQGSLASRTIQQQIPLFPYPMLYGGGLNGSTGFANYNSLQLKMSHTSHGLSVQVNYTWSKELDFVTTGIEDGQGVNATNTGAISTPDLVNNRLNRNYGSDDMPHRIVGIVVYQSPFSAGGPLEPSNKVARGVLGGWSVSSVVSINDGFPVFITGANTGAITGRVHRVPGVPVVLPQSYQHRYNGATAVTLPCGVKVTPANYTTLKYNACAFQGQTVTTPNGSVVADMYWYGDSAQTQGDIRGPGRTNMDLTLSREFTIHEKYKLQIRGLATNFANHAELNTVQNGTLGATNTNAASNPIGYGGGAFGTINMNTFDPRQIVLNGRITF